MNLRVDPAPLMDSEPLRWLRGLAYGRELRSWIPNGFDRYVRILHPAHVWEPSADEVTVRYVPWKDVSAWSGKPFSGTSSIQDLAYRMDGTPWQRQGASLPLEGQLEHPHLETLISILAPITSAPDQVWVLIWEGYKGAAYSATALRRVRAPRRTANAWRRLRNRFSAATSSGPDHGLGVEISPSLTASGRKYFLQRGSIRLARSENDSSTFEEPPNFWWPADRVWFVSTDIDSLSTYVGGPQALINRLLDDDVLEVYPASLDDPFDGRPNMDDL